MANLALYTCNRFLTFSPRCRKYLVTLSTFTFAHSIASIRLNSYHWHVTDVLGFFSFAFIFKLSFTRILSISRARNLREKQKLANLKLYSIKSLTRTEKYHSIWKQKYWKQVSAIVRKTNITNESNCLVTSRNLICFRRVALAKFCQ